MPTDRRNRRLIFFAYALGMGRIAQFAVLAFFYALGFGGPALAQLAPAQETAALKLAQRILAEKAFADAADIRAIDASQASGQARLHNLLAALEHATANGFSADDLGRLDALQQAAEAANDRRFTTVAALYRAVIDAPDATPEAINAIAKRAEGDPLVEVMRLRLVAHAQHWRGLAGEAIASLVRADTLAAQIGQPALALRVSNLLTRANYRMELEDYQGALSDLEAMLALAQGQKTLINGGRAVFILSRLTSRSGALNTAAAIGDLHRELASRSGLVDDAFITELKCATIARDLGDFPRALTCARAGLALGRADSVFGSALHFTSGVASARLGDGPAARASLEAYRGYRDIINSPNGQMRVLELEAETLRAEGRLEEAFAAQRELTRLAIEIRNRRFTSGAIQLRDQMENDVARERERAQAAARQAELQGWLNVLGGALLALGAFVLVRMLRIRRKTNAMITSARNALRQRGALLQTAGAALPAASVTEAHGARGDLDELAAVIKDLEGRDQALARALSALSAARHTAEAASNAKSEFLAVISHELRTPLNAIIGFTEIVKEDVEAGAQVQIEDLNSISAGSARLLAMINQILRFSSVQSAPQKQDLASIAVADIVVRARARAEGLVDPGRIKVTSVVEDGVGELLGDEAHVSAILDELLKNAARFTAAGEISIYARRAGEEIAIDIRDTGEGVPGSKLAAIFQPFVQTDSSYTRRYEGAGLGLAIAKGLAEQMGGRLSVVSEEGRGSIFTLHAPAVAATAELAA